MASSPVALKRTRYRRARRAPSIRMVDQATQTETWPENTTVADPATKTLAWLDDQQQLESQDEDHREAEQTSFQFMDLPIELRREVYRHYINDLPPLMHSSLQICREVADITDRVLTFRMFNGRCSLFELKLDAIELAAGRLASLCDQFQGKNVRLRIELQCPNTFFGMVEYDLEAVLKVIRANMMASVEVYMTKGKVCSFCARYDWGPGFDPVESIREWVERAERSRDI